MVHEEVQQLLSDFVSSDPQLQDVLGESDSTKSVLSDAIHSQLLKKAMHKAAVECGCRADGRGSVSGHGHNTIRPLSIEVPALPEVVHGSALFTRGETQVLCTTTLGPPNEGILLKDPYLMPSSSSDIDAPDTTYTDLPVGSLRYLRNQGTFRI